MAKIFIGKNIKYLREANGDTLEILGEAIGFTKSAVSDYESGRRTPTPKTLNDIAVRYGKTVDEILYSDLTVLEKPNFSKSSIEDFMDKTNKIIPYFTSEKASKNENFKHAYRLTEKMFEQLKQGNFVRGTMITDIFQLYLKAAEEIEETVVYANILWSIFFWWTQICNTEELITLHYKMRAEGIDFIEMSKIYRTVADENKERRKNFISDFSELIIELIKKLKSKFEWANLADYYLALQYMFSIVDTDYSEQMNVAIGIQMMFSYKQLGNTYANEYFRICDEM